MYHGLWGVNAKGVAKYSDYGPIEGYISETVQDRSVGAKLVLITNREVVYELLIGSKLGDLE